MKSTTWSSLAILWLVAAIYLAIYTSTGAGPWDGNLFAAVGGLSAVLCIRSILAAVRAEIRDTRVVIRR